MCTNFWVNMFVLWQVSSITDRVLYRLGEWWLLEQSDEISCLDLHKWVTFMPIRYYTASRALVHRLPSDLVCIGKLVTWRVVIVGRACVKFWHPCGMVMNFLLQAIPWFIFWKFKTSYANIVLVGGSVWNKEVVGGLNLVFVSKTDLRSSVLLIRGWLCHLLKKSCNWMIRVYKGQIRRKEKGSFGMILCKGKSERWICCIARHFKIPSTVSWSFLFYASILFEIELQTWQCVYVPQILCACFKIEILVLPMMSRILKEILYV